VISLVVMPAALATVIAMPFGMEHWPLQLMGFGLNRVLAISDWVAALPGSALALPQIPVATALLLAAAAICLCLARRSGKAWGLAFLLAAPLAQRMPAPPDILIERTAANVALRNPQGELVFALPRKGSFAANRWLQANGEKASLSEAAGRSGWLCSGDICRATHKGRGIAYVTNDKAVVKDCRDVDVLISAVPLRGRCRSVETRIDRFDVWKRGAHAVQIGNGGLSVTTAAGLSGDRPWVVVPTARVKGHDRTRQ
jgi:competence protein ComEC